MRILLVALLAMAILLVPGVSAAATIAEIYAAVSEGEAYSSGELFCQDLELNCSDDDFSTVNDEYADLGDGFTSAASGAIVKNTSNSQSTFLRLVYHVDGLLDNNYSIRIGHVASQAAYEGLICSYINQTHINTTSCVPFSHGANDQWGEHDIDQLVRDSFELFNGAVILRFMQTSGASATITEIYLRRPFKEADFQLLPQGVTTGDINQQVENEWIIISQAEIPISNPVCQVSNLYGDILNATAIQLDVQLINDGEKLRVRWFTNETQVIAGENYEVNCDFTAGESVIIGVEQYVYMTVDGGILNDLATLLTGMLRALGFLEDPVEMHQLTTQVPASGDINIRAQVTLGGELVVGALCNTTIYDSAGSALYTNVAMEDTATGIYNYSFADVDLAPYETQFVCSINDSTDTFRLYRSSGSIAFNPAAALAENKALLDKLLLEVQVGATEYFPGDPGKVFAKALLNNVELNGTACSVTVHYPNGSQFIEGVLMEPVIAEGLIAESYYHHDFVVPEVLGVFPVTVVCSLDTFQQEFAGPPAITINIGAFVDGLDTDLEVRDEVFYSVREQAKRIDVEFEFAGIVIDNATTSLSFHFDAQRLFGGAGDPPSDVIILSLFNYTSASWVQVGSPYAYTSGVFPFTVTITEGFEDYVGGGGSLIIRVEDTVGPPEDNAIDTLMEFDRVVVEVVTTGGLLPATLIKSSSEVHVNTPPFEMDLSEGMFFSGQTAKVSNVLYWANAPAFSQFSFVSDAQCFIALHYPNGTSWQVLEMNVTNGGVYVVDVTFPEFPAGNYIARGSCQGGSLEKLARDSSTLIVMDGIKMAMIS